MNPRLVRELDRAGAALVQRVRAIPAGDRRDLSAHIDGKNDVARDLAALLKRYREVLGGGAAQTPADLFGGPVRIARRRARHVEGGLGR